MDLTLERIRKLLSFLPTYTRPTVHIAGTNGKGSTAAIVSSILVASNITTGRYNSPHLVHIWDSISLNGAPITESYYLETREKVERADADHAVGASTFEILTATALMVFEQARVDIVVLEVGLGGRLDATNAISDDCVLVSAITAIDIDHSAILGKTVEEIAKEKAGIARTGKPCVVGPQMSPKVEAAIREVLESIGSELVGVVLCKRRQWEDSTDGNVPLPFSFQPVFQPPPPQPISVSLSAFQTPIKAMFSMQGAHQLDNLSTALTIIHILTSHTSLTQHRANNLNRIIQSTIVAGIRSARWFGRLHFLHLITPTFAPSTNQGALLLNHNVNLNPSLQLDMTLIIDGAHNTAACTVLQSYLTDIRVTEKRTFILSLSSQVDKSVKETLAPLLKSGDTVVVVPFSHVAGMPWVRPVGPKELCKAVRSLVGDEGVVYCEEPESESWSACKFRDTQEDRPAVQAQLDRGIHWAATRTKLAILTGSLYLAGELYRLIKDETGTASSSVVAK